MIDQFDLYISETTVRYYVTIKHLRVRARGDITCEFECAVHFLRMNKNRKGMSILTSEPFMVPSFLYL